MPVLSVPTAGARQIWRDAPKRRPGAVFDRVLLLLAVLAIVWAAVEFHNCGVMHREMNQGLSAEMSF